MDLVNISEIEEINICFDRGYNPLLDKRFKMDIALRIQVQRELFGHSFLSRGDIPKANERFYRWMWDCKPHYCEECLKPLNNYSSVWISHILTRGAFPEMAHDPRNVNILCHRHHEQWETGERKTMRIYPGNVKIINLLKTEYQIINKTQ